MLESKNLHKVLWGEVVDTTVYLSNRAPTKSLEGKMPLEVWIERKTQVDHLIVSRSIVHVKNLG